MRNVISKSRKDSKISRYKPKKGIFFFLIDVNSPCLESMESLLFKRDEEAIWGYIN